MIIPSMARTRRYMHGQRRRCASPFKHGDQPHPKGATGDEIDSQHSDIYGRDHDESDHERWSKPDTPPVNEEPTRKESRQLRRQARKDVRRRHKQAVQEWKEGGKEGDRPKKW